MTANHNRYWFLTSVGLFFHVHQLNNLLLWFEPIPLHFACGPSENRNHSSSSTLRNLIRVELYSSEQVHLPKKFLSTTFGGCLLDDVQIVLEVGLDSELVKLQSWCLGIHRGWEHIESQHRWFAPGLDGTVHNGLILHSSLATFHHNCPLMKSLNEGIYVRVRSFDVVVLTWFPYWGGCLTLGCCSHLGSLKFRFLSEFLC